MTHTQDGSLSGITMRGGERWYRRCFKNTQPQVEGGKNKQERRNMFEKKGKGKKPKVPPKKNPFEILLLLKPLALIVSAITPGAS